MKTIIVPITLSLVFLSAVSACTKADTGQAPILQALSNADFPLDLASTGKAQLKDGVFEEPVAAGSATNLKVQLGKVQATGDINGDKTTDAAVTLEVDSGGSGSFTYLAAAISVNGVANPVASTLLGDRIIVESITIEAGKIVVRVLDRKPNEPMSAQPKNEASRTFKLQGDELVEEGK